MAWQVVAMKVRTSVTRKCISTEYGSSESPVRGLLWPVCESEGGCWGKHLSPTRTQKSFSNLPTLGREDWTNPRANMITVLYFRPDREIVNVGINMRSQVINRAVQGTGQLLCIFSDVPYVRVVCEVRYDFKAKWYLEIRSLSGKTSIHREILLFWIPSAMI